MQKFDSLEAVINAIIDEIEAQGAQVRITGGSAQSCSTYLDVNGLAVRISDHAPQTQLSVVDYHIGLGSLHGDNVIDVHPIYEQLIIEMDEDGEEISSEYVECGEDDDDAEHVGYKVSMDEIKRLAADTISTANEKEEE